MKSDKNAYLKPPLNILTELNQLEVFHTLKEWLLKIKIKTPELLLYSESCHARLVEKCLKRNMALPSVLGWGDSFLIDQMFFNTGGAYKLDDWGRPQNGEEISISPIRVFDSSEAHGYDEVMVPVCVTGIVINKGLLTFDLKKSENLY
jgi:hypothetical protein